MLSAPPRWPRAARRPAAADRQSDGQTLVLDELARIDWIEKSDVAALREGVIEKMELQIGMPVKNGRHDRHLASRDRRADRQEEPSCRPEQRRPRREGRGPEGGRRSRSCARNKRLNDRKPGMVSAEEVAKAEGELKVADAP